MYDVVIAYRIYPQVSKKPLVFGDDKFRLSELCLASLQNSLGALNVKMYALLDNCPEQYTALFQKYFSHSDLEIIDLPGLGNGATFKKQIELLLSQNKTEYVYFAEDDYLYRPNQFSEMIDFMQSFPKADFVTPYDHNDYYVLDFHDHSVRSRSSGAYHWHIRNSTCLTFLARLSSLRRSAKVFETYVRKNSDASIWLSLTKYRIGNPALLLKYLFKDRDMFKLFIKAWYFNSFQIMFGPRYELWSPVPAIGTHMQYDAISPAIDWNEEINAILKKIE